MPAAHGEIKSRLMVRSFLLPGGLIRRRDSLPSFVSGQVQEPLGSDPPASFSFLARRGKNGAKVEFLRELNGPILMRVTSGILVLLLLLILLIWGVDPLGKKIFPATYKGHSELWDRVIKRAKERVLWVVLPIYIIGLFALLVLKVSDIWPSLFWPAIVFAVVFIALFYGTQRSG
jgi:hypothetical protein